MVRWVTDVSEIRVLIHLERKDIREYETAEVSQFRTRENASSSKSRGAFKAAKDNSNKTSLFRGYNEQRNERKNWRCEVLPTDTFPTNCF